MLGISKNQTGLKKTLRRRSPPRKRAGGKQLKEAHEKLAE